jgi:hypothetical protein
MPTAVNGQLFYSQDEVQAGLPQYHAAIRQATGYTGQFSADPTQKFQQYITGATSEQQAAARRLAAIYGSGSFGPGTTAPVREPDIGRVPPIWREPVRPTGREPDIGRVPPIWPERNASSLPLGGTSTGDRNWGANQDKNQWIAQQTGYGGDFGGGNFSAWASQNGVDVAALEQQWYQQPVVTEPYEYPGGGDRNWGANQDKNQWIAQQTGYGGDFGGGNFTDWASQNGVNVAALEQQWSKQQPVVPVPYEDPSGPGIGQQGLMTGITGLATGQQGLMTGQQNLQTGITGLETGQQNIQTGVTGLETGQQGLMSGQQALGAGQGAIQGVIGAPGEGQPTTLFSGQAGLMGGQQALGQQLTGGIQDITGAVGGVSQNIDALERAAEQYQREAQRQRSQIQTAGLTGREQIARQVADVGQQVNTGVEQQRSLMGGMAAPVAAMGATAGIQPGGATQAATQYAQTQKFAPPAQGQQTIMGPMGPMTVDPRDQVTRPVSSSGLMNYPV